MSRKLKNIIMICIIVLLTGSIAFTVYKANTSKVSTTNNTQMMEGNMGTPPDKPEENDMNSNSTTENDSTDKQNTENRPSIPNNNSGTNSNNNMGTPPAKPEESNNNGNGNSNSNGGNMTPPSMDGNSNNMTPPDKPSNESTSSSTTDASIHIIYYVILGCESLLLTIIVLYLIMSKFNQKGFKETFSERDKILIYCLSIILCTSALTFGTSYIANNLNVNTNNNSNSNGAPNNSNSSINYSASNEITSNDNISDKEYSSNTKDENSLLIDSATTTLSNITVTKEGDSDGGDSTSFYGTNSAILAKNGANVTITNATIETNANGANGVFSYGGSATTNNSSSDGTTINISDSKITTTKNNSGGIMTTGGGVMNASNLTITTSGISSAAIRSDRGGGVVKVDKGTYKTTGQGSPAIYSTADITVSNATLEATASEGVVIEGENAVTLNNVTLVDTNNKLNGKSTTYKNIFIYQSMSGDAKSGNATFTSKNSTITTNKGDTLYVTNTTATINLEGNTFINNDASGNFLRIQKDSWGNSGSNGGNVTLNLTKQSVKGNIIVDSISTLEINMVNSNYEGTINGDNDAKEISLNLDKDSTITLTGDTYVTSLNNKNTSNSNINFNGYKLYVNGKSIN